MIEARKNLEILWKEWEGRLLLINIANQLQAGVIAPDDLDSFLKKAAKEDVDFSTRARALGDESNQRDAFSQSNLHFVAKVSPEKEGEQLFLRIAPMHSILEMVELVGEDPISQAERRSNALSQLTILRKIPNLNEDGGGMEIAEELLHKYLFSKDQTSQVVESWKLPDNFAEWDLTLGRLNTSGVALRDANSEPVFFAPIANASAACGVFEEASNIESPADHFRDMLGLDHFGREYNNERTILGFYLIRLKQIKKGKSFRPTPFDNTSPGRFRSCYGIFGGKRGNMGRTANLANLSSKSPVEGVAEVVCPNNSLYQAKKEILIGYLGPLEVPRGDAYVSGSNAKKQDKAFLKACMGGWHKADLIDEIVGAKVT